MWELLTNLSLKTSESTYGANAYVNFFGFLSPWMNWFQRCVCSIASSSSSGIGWQGMKTDRLVARSVLSWPGLLEVKKYTQFCLQYKTLDSITTFFKLVMLLWTRFYSLFKTCQIKITLKLYIKHNYNLQTEIKLK